ncbi:CU044_5270 family protein [Streptomyces sp. NPDC005248]|uniref:CU044_5270 family protein n=1 Tax=Streptomyces sp. NPDC005248 TaxID=3364709 RepID=UPI0036AF8C2E
MRDIDEALRALDPAKLTNGEDQVQVHARLDAIVNSPRPASPGRSHRPRRWVLVGAAVAAAMATVFVAVDPFGTTSQPAYAVTPQPLHYQHSARSAGRVLEEIARRVEGLPDNRPPAWSSEHFVQQSWSLSTRVDGTQVTSAVIPERRETWEKPDGSSRWTARTLRPQFQNSEQRKVWEASGAIGEDPKTWSGSGGPSKSSTGEPPSSSEGMRKWLATGQSSLSPGLTFEVVPERFMDHVFSPAQRAALLRALKDTKGVVYEGTVKDRAGRTGEAFSLTSRFGGLPNKTTMVFDASTGSLLAYEEELTTDAGALHVEVPAVIGYTTFLTSERIA